MVASPNLAITLLSSAQAQKEVTVNEAIIRFDAILNNGVIDQDLSTPPVSPTDGDLYIVATGGTGAWSGHDGDLAYYYGGWRFIDPKEGMNIWINDENVMYFFNGTTWQAGTSAQNVPLMGINTTADSTNKLSVSSAAILFNNAGAGVQVKLNKAASGDTNSFLFQTGFSARAEFGCTGDDNFHFKVSPDGSTFHEAFILDRNNGNTQFQKFFKVPAASTLTIATGAVTATKSHHKIDTEAAAASDDLDTISGGSEGAIIIIEPADDARTVVVRNNGGGSGNIRTASGASVSLDNYGDTFMAMFDGTNWLQL